MFSLCVCLRACVRVVLLSQRSASSGVLGCVCTSFTKCYVLIMFSSDRFRRAETAMLQNHQ